MKKIHTACLLSILLLLVFSFATQAQSKPAKQPGYKEFVGENPNAEKDLKTVGDYINALVAGDFATAKSLMADNYKAAGPSPKDSANRDQEITNWTEGNKTQLDRKTSFVSETFRVLQGDQKGDWVSVWGDYSFTQNGTTVKFPYQYTAHLTNGKIDRSFVYYDRQYISETLGYKLTPPGK
jgi:ketosteroid isomerase-like protein